MRSKIGLLLLASAVAGCAYKPHDLPDRGLAAVNVPVVTRADYVFDAAASDGDLPPTEQSRLDAWFRGLNVGYGDSIFVDAPYAPAARADVARIAGGYGLMVVGGAPVTAGEIAPGTVRVVVSRNRAEVPNCPNWNRPAQPNYNNQTMPSFGCAVNSSLASMVANPEDLIHGREGSGVGDAKTATRAINVYRTTPPTGTQGLQDINTKKGK